jgi:hypothetical protein
MASFILGERIETPRRPASSSLGCKKYRTKKCPSTVLLNTADHTLTSSGKPHIHEPGNLVAEEDELKQSLKRKAVDQHHRDTELSDRSIVRLQYRT